MPMCRPNKLPLIPGRCRLLAGVAVMLAACASASATEGRVEYGWRMFSGDGRVDQQQPQTSVSVPLELLTRPQPIERSDSVDMSGPAQTRADVSVYGKVDLLARSLAVGVQAHTKVNPYDPDSNTLDPVLLTAMASVQAGFVDRVVVLDPTLLPGAPITFSIQPLQTSGRMQVQHGPTGGGVTNFLIGFSMDAVLGSSALPTLLSFEQIVVAGSPTGSSWDASALGGLASLAGGAITVPNGSIWDVSFVVRAAVQSLPSLLPATNPIGTVSSANFRNTVYWGGITGAIDALGQPLPQLTLQSALGMDWVSPVPEPAPVALLLAGLGLLALTARRRLVF